MDKMNIEDILKVARSRSEYQTDFIVGDTHNIIFLMEGDYDKHRNSKTYNIIKVQFRGDSHLIKFMIGYKEEDFGFVMDTDPILVLGEETYICQNVDSKNYYLQLNASNEDIIQFFKEVDLIEYFNLFERAYLEISIKEREIQDKYLNIHRVIS